MRPILLGAVPVVLSLAALSLAAPSSFTSPAAVAAADTGACWPSFRGPRASGIAAGRPAPLRWSAETGQNIRWRTPIPGLGHSSPVIAGGRLYVTTAISGRPDPELRVGLFGDIGSVRDDTVHEWKLLCLDARSGRILWERTAHRGVPRVKRHSKSTHANSTPAADGRRVVAFFGSEGLYCYDRDGSLLWKKDLGLLDSGYFQVPAAQWGFASSPVIWKDRVIVQCDVQKDSFLAAFRLADGQELWRTARRDVPTWSTPTVFEAGGGVQVAVNGWKHIGGYDARTGAEIWRLTGGGDIPVPTPVVDGGLIFITNAHGRMAPIYAVRTSARGDVTPAPQESSGPHLAWSRPRDGGYMQTPIVYDGRLYVCRDNGVLGCWEAATGRQLYQERVGAGSGFTASAVAAGGRLYYAGEDGDVRVVQAGAEFRLLATNPLGESVLASPAACDGTLYFRTRGRVIAVGEQPGGSGSR